MTTDSFLLISLLISKINYLMCPICARFFTQWMYAPGFPCQKSVLIFMSSVSCAMKCKGTVKLTLFGFWVVFFSSFTFSIRTLERQLCFSQLCPLATSMWVHDPEAGGHTDARSILNRLMQSFQQLNISEMHSILILSPFLWEWCFLWGCLG